MLKSMRHVLIWRGVLALIVGLVAVGWPGVTVGVVVFLFAVYALLIAGTDLLMAFRARRAGLAIGHVLLAVVSAATGVLALTWPGVTVVALVLIVACWALAAGILQVFIAFRRESGTGERAMWALGGMVSIAFAVALVVRPASGALSLATVFGLFSVVHGIAMLIFAAHIKKLDAQMSRLVPSCRQSGQKCPSIWRREAPRVG